MSEAVNHPNHYQSASRCSKCSQPIECIDVVKSMGFTRGNAMKYLWRAGLKIDEREDLLKAKWYIDQLIRELDEREAMEQND